jgi:hypothetical protein
MRKIGKKEQKEEKRRQGNGKSGSQGVGIRLTGNQEAEFGLSHLRGRIYAVFVTQYAIRNANGKYRRFFRNLLDSNVRFSIMVNKQNAGDRMTG